MTWWRVACVCAAIAAASTPASAHDRLMRRIGAQEGLVPSTVWVLAQDERGVMWIGTAGGLYRYDGRTVRRWAAAAVSSSVTAIQLGGGGTLFVRDEDRVLAVDSVHEDVAPVLFEGRPLDGVVDIRVLAGELWISRADGVRRRDAAGRWSAPVPGPTGINLLRTDASSIYAASNEVIWRIDRGGTAHPAGRAERITDVLVMPDGSLRVTQFMGEVVAIDRDGNHQVTFQRGARALALRGGTLWVLTADRLIGMPPGRPDIVIAREAGLRSGVTMFVDREGVLWLATYEGLVILPEPETEIWSDFDGVKGGPLAVRKTDEGYWISAWHETLWLAPGERRAKATDWNLYPVCPDGHGGWWAMGARELVHRDRPSGRFETWALPEADHWSGGDCAVAPDGATWSHVSDRIVRIAPDGEQRWLATPATRAESIDTIHVDQRNRLWIAIGKDRACHADLRRPIDASAWTCRTIEGAMLLRKFLEPEAGTVWLATDPVGVQRFDEPTGVWSMIPGSRALATHHLLWPGPSPRGGVWLTGHGILMRVRERRDLEAGWEIVERPTSWHGLVSTEAGAVFEEPEGDLWVVHNVGVQHVPRAVRDLRPEPPGIVLLDVTVDGVRIRHGADLELPSGSHQLELEFAAPSYRDPQQLRYRVRTGRDARWSPTDNPSLRFVDLPPGTHHIEVAASLDGERWSAIPAAFEVDIGQPWYLRWWAIGSAAVLLVGLGVALQRIRTTIRLRLVHQRQQIAMDLHDEMGSGLGSIGILAELASNDVLAERNRREVATRIAETAGDLGVALGDIVWSLRDRSATLDALVARLVERARRLFPDELGVLALEVAEQIPPTPLSIAVRRNVLRIGLEALHNAARHARATKVTFGVAQESRRAWRLWVADDGIGLDAAATSATRGGGHGLAGMQQRATAIRAELAIESPARGGTRILLVFDPGGGASHVRARDGGSR